MLFIHIIFHIMMYKIIFYSSPKLLPVSNSHFTLFKVKQDLLFVLCGYFSHKLDAYIHLELKTKKFYLQNSGHGSASMLATRGRVSWYLMRKTKAIHLINNCEVIKQKYHKYCINIL